LGSLVREIDERIEQLLQAYQEEMALLMTIPRVKKEIAAVIIAEIGVDMGQFPTSQRLASWVGVAPGNHESAGKRKITRTIKGNPHIKLALSEAAWALSHCRNQRSLAKYWPLAARSRKEKNTRCE
jgi:transposase